MKILIVDDERMIREAVASYLEQNGWHVFQAETGQEALTIFQQEAVSFVILDLMLPDLSGEDVCIRLRECSQVPIIMLTAKTMEQDMLNGLDMGADDYITKPFSLKNLYARIQAVLRRSSGNRGQKEEAVFWNQGELSVNYNRREICKRGKVVSVTPIEWKLLTTFTRYPQKIFTREELIELVFGMDFSGYDRVIDTHVKNLRKKLEDDPRQPVYICTVHGMGYKFGGVRK